jgi:hypothetical protein
MEVKGRIRVGKSKFYNGKVIIPQYTNFTPIIVMPKTEYESLDPYHLKNEQGQILECVWQFSKVYQFVPQVSVPYSSGNKKIVWQWPSEIHIDNNEILTDKYWNWRSTGKNNSEPVRAPVGWKHLKNCLFALEKDEPISETNPKLDYIESRKKIYFPIYMKSVIKEPKFCELYNRLHNGENLLIIEIDGPHQESFNYYKEKYGVGNDFIENDSIEATEQNLGILLNDPKHPFGHGYCLAWTLMLKF